MASERSDVTEIPYKKDGGLWFTEPKQGHANLIWRAPEEFEGELKLVSYQKTPKGDFFLWADTETNVTYPMIPEELHDMLLKALVEDGYIEGSWTVVQHGSKYSLSLVEEIID
jgi:hypothetical protein